MNIVSFSGGKDSTAMLLMMIEKGMHIDEIIFCDTGKEFDELIAHVDKVEKYIGMKITRLKAEHDYEYYLYKIPRVKSGGNGYGWSSVGCRWCTSYLKTNVMKKYIKEKYKGKEVHWYIGIAYDEPKRIKEDIYKHYPLYEWEITEANALKYCYDKGFDFGGLYQKFTRLGCWCCPLQRIDELYTLYKYYPDKWKQLLKMEIDLYENISKNLLTKFIHFRHQTTVHALDGRFKMQKLIEERLGD